MDLLTTPSVAVNEFVAEARAAQREWQRLPVRQRLRHVTALRHLLATESEALCSAVARDIGKSAEETIGGDILPLAEACRFLEKEAARLLAPHRVRSGLRPVWLAGQTDTIHHRPRGVVGIIGTWNYPLYLNGVQIVQAVTAGNAVIWKPSEVAPVSAAALFELCERAGFPHGLIQWMEPTREGGPALAEAAVDHVVFTGSADTGRRLARRLGERLVSSTLELSGCDAMIVLDDADIALAARAAWFGTTLNRGQTCLAVRRAFVQRKNYSAFCDAMRDLSRSAPSQHLALPSAAAQARRLVDEAVEGGGRLAQNPVPSAHDLENGTYVPTVILDARPEMGICREASFAPILAVLPFDDMDDLFAMEQQCTYALGASIFTRNSARAEAIAACLRSGAVTVNDTIAPTAHPATPFGGRGDSGWGLTQGAEGLLELTATQVVSHKSGRFRPHYDLAAGGNAASQGPLLRGLLQAGHAPTFSERLGGWRQVAAAGLKMMRGA